MTITNKIVEDDIATNPTLIDAMVYQSCSVCYYIGAPNENWMREDQTCPKCGAVGSPTGFLSNIYFLRHFKQIQEAYRNRDQMPEVVKVICAFVIESFINEAIRKAHSKAQRPLKSDFIETANLIRKCNRLGILAKLFTEAAANNARNNNHLLLYLQNSTDPQLEDMREIMKSWDNLRRCRNDVAHALLIQRGNNISPEEAFWTVVNFRCVLRWILNQV